MKVEKGEIEIRLAGVGDAGAMAGVLREAFEEYIEMYTEGGFAATTPTGDRIEARMDEGPAWVAMLDGEIVGTVAAVPRGEELYVRSMAVLPSARGNRIGEMLLGYVEEFAREHGLNRLVLSTTPFLERAIARYEKWGFRRCGDGPQELWGHRFLRW